LLSIRRISLGGGFRYLMESVAAGDTGTKPAGGLAAYYAASGTPAGRFLGIGLADLDGGIGVAAGSEVSEEHLRRMLGEMCDPVNGEPVGAMPILSAKRVPVAGFDLTFSPSKSVSVAWALADPETKAVIYDCHRRAIDYVLSFAEREVFRSRSGPQGVVEERTVGVVAAAFTHWDSRSGDPQLHDHVVVWNRARSLSDGAWRTLDSRGLFKAAVMLSELHQGVLSDLLTGALGVGWEGRERRHSEHPHWEISGVGQALMDEFSRRSGQVEARTEQMIGRFVETHGRQPTTVERMRLCQQATLETRPEKERRSLAVMTADWRRRAEAHLGPKPEQVAWVSSLAGRNDLPVLKAADLGEAILSDAARAARDAVAARRATFSRWNVTAEALRILHGVRFASPDERVAIAERITELALGDTVLLSPAGVETDSRKLYTTEAILQAEDRLVDAARCSGGPVISRQTVAQVADQTLPDRDERLSLDQAFAVEQITTSGRPLDLLVGPAGTGKSTTMAALRAAWETEHGPGSVIGLAPSAAAAETLAIELGTATENTAKWLHEWRRVPELVARRRRLAASPAGPAARRQLATLDADIATRSPRPGQLFIIDEASLAGTLALDELVTAATTAGAKVLLVGDHAQLSSVEASGAFAMLVRDGGDLTPRLSEVRRFSEDWEKQASLDLRSGRSEAIDAYRAHSRVLQGDRAGLVDAIYQSWKADVEAGKASLMIAGDGATVGELNERARADRIAAAIVDDVGVEIAGGQRAGVGDLVVTRQNSRRLPAGDRWVKNGDRWIVTAVQAEGGLRVRRADGAGEALLPARYVSEHVELAYATTAYQAQGRTVDTAHALVTPTTTREVLYVSATRGRESNWLYVDTCFDPDPETGHEGMTQARGVREVLEGVLANQAAEVSAHQAGQRLRQAQKDLGSVNQCERQFPIWYQPGDGAVAPTISPVDL
jgi:conjugative relaxase-like TrwC/TraI family protein